MHHTDVHLRARARGMMYCNDEGSELCAADGWIDEGWEHVTGTLSKLSG